MNYEIRSYSDYDNWTVTTNSKNVSDIMSKMVERAGRICERYASDIFYGLSDYDYAVQAAEKYDKVLCFRENGINTWGVRDDIHKPKIILARIERTKKIIHEAQVASKKAADKNKIIFAIVLTLCLSLIVVGIVKMTIVKNELRSEYSQITPSVIEAINNRAHWYEDYNAGVRCLVLGILLSSLVLMIGWPMVKGAKITVKL